MILSPEIPEASPNDRKTEKTSKNETQDIVCNGVKLDDMECSRAKQSEMRKTLPFRQSTKKA